jgi:hypothetical protein
MHGTFFDHIYLLHYLFLLPPLFPLHILSSLNDFLKIKLGPRTFPDPSLFIFLCRVELSLKERGRDRRGRDKDPTSLPTAR